MGRRLRIVAAALAALVVGVAFLLYARGVRSEAERERSEMLARYGGEVVDLVVAERTLEAGEVVAAEDVEVREWLADLAPVGAVTDRDEVVGATVTEPAAQGAPLTQVNFRDASESADVPSGCVALVVPMTEELGVPSNVTIGAHVVAYRVGDGDSRVVSADMVVLSVPVAQTGLAAGGRTVSVAVRPEEVADVLAASDAGELRVVIPAEDVESVPDPREGAAPDEVEPVDTEEGER